MERFIVTDSEIKTAIKNAVKEMRKLSEYPIKLDKWKLIVFETHITLRVQATDGMNFYHHNTAL